jgi:DNA adenine methylase
MVIKYPGSKKRISPWIVGQFPDNYPDMVYLEPYFGSGSVFFEKKPSAVETINDIDGEVINLFKQIRDRQDELIRLISLTPWSRQEYDNAFSECDNDLEKARRFLVRSWLSRGGCGNLYHNGVRFDKKYNGHKSNFCDILPERIALAATRLLHSEKGVVQIECKDAIDLIKEYNHDDVLMYLDPPYPRESRNKNKLYRYEYKTDDHLRLIESISTSKAHVIISSYSNELYNSALNNWHCENIISTDEAGNNKQETIWRNYRINTGFLFEELKEGIAL